MAALLRYAIMAIAATTGFAEPYYYATYVAITPLITIDYAGRYAIFAAIHIAAATDAAIIYATPHYSTPLPHTASHNITLIRLAVTYELRCHVTASAVLRWPAIAEDASATYAEASWSHTPCHTAHALPHTSVE